MSKRKRIMAEQKVAIVRRHLVENVPVSDLCDELGVHPNQYYGWQKQFFENGAAAFERRPSSGGLTRLMRKDGKMRPTGKSSSLRRNCKIATRSWPSCCRSMSS